MASAGRRSLEHLLQDPSLPEARARIEVESAIVAEAHELGTEVLSRLRKGLDAEEIRERPEWYPILLRLAGARSRSEAQKRFGSGSERSISRDAADRLALAVQSETGGSWTPESLIRTLGPTIEGIVRDLFGRVYLETKVAQALTRHGVQYLPESEIQPLAGLHYHGRPDFLCPDQDRPSVAVQVRRASSRHASLYAKDMMFSALDWKARQPELVNVGIYAGPWTASTLRAIEGVFDLVGPIDDVDRVAMKIRGLGG